MRSVTLRVGTFNILNTFLWAERGEICLTAARGAALDLLGLQEVNFDAHQAQEVALATQRRSAPATSMGVVNAPTPEPFHHPSVRSFRIDGNAVVLDRARVAVSESAVYALGDNRVCQRLRADVDGVVPLSFTNAHLHHTGTHPSVRARQVKSMLEYVRARDAHDGAAISIIVGDFNAVPTEPAYRLMVEAGEWERERERDFHSRSLHGAGYRSCYAVAHDGKEPEYTWHLDTIGLEAFEAEVFPHGSHHPDEPPHAGNHPQCVDYIWIRSNNPTFAVNVKEAGLFGHKPVRGVYASDHFGISATLSIDARSKL